MGSDDQQEAAGQPDDGLTQFVAWFENSVIPVVKGIAYEIDARDDVDPHLHDQVEQLRHIAEEYPDEAEDVADEIRDRVEMGAVENRVDSVQNSAVAEKGESLPDGREPEESGCRVGSARSTDAPSADERRRCPYCPDEDEQNAPSTAYICPNCLSRNDKKTLFAFQKPESPPSPAFEDVNVSIYREGDGRLRCGGCGHTGAAECFKFTSTADAPDTSDSDDVVFEKAEDVDMDGLAAKPQGESGVDGPEPAAWRSSCGNEDCDWHNKHFRKPSVQNKTCPWCGDEEVSLEPYAVEIEQVAALLDDRIEQHQDRLDERGGPGHGQPEKLAGKIEALEELREQIGEVER